MNEADDLTWRTATRVHDWNDRVFLLRLLTQAVDLGIIGGVDWLQTTTRGPRRTLPAKARGSLPEQLLGVLPGRARVRYLEAGADGSHPWRLSLLLPRIDSSGKRLDGMGVAALRFSGRPFASTDGSAQLAQAFRAVHSPADTEHAGLHWHADWERLKDSAFRPSVTSDPMFNGVVWANFLGPCHIDQFDPQTLLRLPPKCCQWVADQGLFFMSGLALHEVRSPTAEQDLARWTDVFRAARVRSINPGVD